MIDTRKQDPDELVTVRLKRAIAYDGVVLRPKIQDAQNGQPQRLLEPLICRIPRRIAEAHGPDTCEIVADKPAAKAVEETPADKQFTGGKKK